MNYKSLFICLSSGEKQHININDVVDIVITNESGKYQVDVLNIPNNNKYSVDTKIINFEEYNKMLDL